MADFCDLGSDREERMRVEAISRALASRPLHPADLAMDEDGRIICTDCGEPIPAARLEASPHALRCIGCQTEMEA